MNPIISPNWLSDPRDQDIAVAAFRRGRQLFSTNAIKPVVQAEAFPGTNVTTHLQILETVKQSVNSVYNAAGTNKMGKVDDPLAVVDSKGRVIGMKSLRIVDASIFPFLPPGQPSATVCMSALWILHGMSMLTIADDIRCASRENRRRYCIGGLSESCVNVSMLNLEAAYLH